MSHRSHTVLKKRSLCSTTRIALRVLSPSRSQCLPQNLPLKSFCGGGKQSRPRQFSTVPLSRYETILHITENRDTKSNKYEGVSKDKFERRPVIRTYSSLSDKLVTAQAAHTRRSAAQNPNPSESQGFDIVEKEHPPHLSVTFDSPEATLETDRILKHADSEHRLSPAVARWRQLFAALSWPEDRDLPKARESLNEYSVRASSFIGTGNADDVRHRWLQGSRSKPLLAEIMVGCLVSCAKSSLVALSAIDQIPWWMRAESLLYLRRTRAQELETLPELHQIYRDQLVMLRDPSSWPKFHMNSQYLDLIVKGLPEHEAILLLHKYLDTYPWTEISCLLYAVDCFTRHGDVTSALFVLKGLPLEQWQRSEPLLLGRCINLLALDSLELTESASNFKILPILLELGLRPNYLLHNVVVQNAVKADLPNVAWDLYRYMHQEGIEITTHTCLALLKYSFLRQDLEGLNEIMTAIHEQEDLAQDPYLIAYTMNIVRNVCYFERKADSTESLHHLLAVYDRAYDRAPLVKLGIIRSNTTALKDKVLSEPSPAGLAFTIWSYVLVQRHPRTVTRLWEVIVDLIDHGDMSIREAAKHDVFYSGFILFYSRDQGNLRKGLKVLQYMLELGLCQPKDLTWSQTICSFLKYYEEVPAERLRELMMLRGVQITPDAWKFVLSKYPRSIVAEKVQRILDEKSMPEGLEHSMRDAHRKEQEDGGMTL